MLELKFLKDRYCAFRTKFITAFGTPCLFPTCSALLSCPVVFAANRASSEEEAFLPRFNSRKPLSLVLFHLFCCCLLVLQLVCSQVCVCACACVCVCMAEGTAQAPQCRGYRRELLFSQHHNRVSPSLPTRSTS